MLLVGTYSCIKLDSRKARERELATFDENRRTVGMRLRAIKIEAPTEGVREDTCDHCLSRRSLRVKNNHLRMRLESERDVGIRVRVYNVELKERPIASKTAVYVWLAHPYDLLPQCAQRTQLDVTLYK